LHEAGQQDGLFDEGDDGGDYVTTDRHADGYDEADDAEDSTPARARRVTAEEYLRQLDEDGDEEFAADFRAMLKKHAKQKGGGDDARPGGQVVAGQGVSGPGGRVSRESRAWLYKLRHGESLMESRRRDRKAARWAARLLIEKKASSRNYE
jgi:hypothetical protein